MSLPAPPLSVSAPAPPTIVSFPEPPVMVSALPLPMMVKTFGLPAKGDCDAGCRAGDRYRLNSLDRGVRCAKGAFLGRPRSMSD